MRLATHPHRPGRVTVHQEDKDFLTWRVTVPDRNAGGIYFATHDEAVHFAHDFAHDLAVRAIQDGAA